MRHVLQQDPAASLVPRSDLCSGHGSRTHNAAIRPGRPTQRLPMAGPARQEQSRTPLSPPRPPSRGSDRRSQLHRRLGAMAPRRNGGGRARETAPSITRQSPIRAPEQPVSRSRHREPRRHEQRPTATSPPNKASRAFSDRTTTAHGLPTAGFQLHAVVLHTVVDRAGVRRADGARTGALRFSRSDCAQIPVPSKDIRHTKRASPGFPGEARKSAITYFPAEQYHRRVELHFCVRDGNRCFLDPIVTDKTQWRRKAPPSVIMSRWAEAHRILHIERTPDRRSPPRRSAVSTTKPSTVSTA